MILNDFFDPKVMIVPIKLEIGVLPQISDV